MELAGRGVAPAEAGIDEPTDRGAAVRSVALTRQAFPFALALLAGALLAPAPARGVALGNVAAQSPLGQPLRVEIPVVLSSGETLNAACLKLVADNVSGAPPQIVTGRVSLERATTSPRLVVATSTPVNEPAIRLAVQAGCGNTMRRDYVLLLDPPGAESPTMVASAEVEEPSWTAPPPSSPTAPRTTWGRSLLAATQPAQEQTHPPVSVSETRSPTLVAAAPAAPQRELVTLVGGTGSGSFIPEAAAAGLPMRPLPSPTASGKSLPLISMPGSRPQQPVPAVAVWQQMWPYAAGVIGTILLALAAFVMQRRIAAQTWVSPSARASLNSETQAGAPQVTFAHFGAMTEPVPNTPRVPMAPAALGKEQTVAITELDTLLHDIQNDLIDERTIKEAWKAAAADAAIDLGGDSILKAIAAAERDLQIGAPEPAQTAMDTALDNELLTVPNLQPTPKRR
jgi:hypothetical protein